MLKLTFTGDIMSSKLNNSACMTADGKFDYSRIISGIDFADSDYVCGNLETPITDQPNEYTDSHTRFNTPVEFLDSLKKIGFDFFSLANNHIMDRGISGIKNTIRHLKRYHFDYSGAYLTAEDSHNLFIKEIKGVKIAFVSFTYGTNAEDHHNILRPEEEFMVDSLRAQPLLQNIRQPYTPKRIYRGIKNRMHFIKNLIYTRKTNIPAVEYFCGSIQDCVPDNAILRPEDESHIRKLHSKLDMAQQYADITILCLHIGGQYNNAIGKYTEYIYSLLRKKKIDVIIGNHPHCILRGRRTTGRIETYSLGNFTFTPRNGWYNFNVYADYSILLSIIIDENSKQISQCIFAPLKVIRNEDNTSTTHYVYDLIANEKDKLKKHILENDNKEVLRRFTGKTISDVKKFYELGYEEDN